MFFFFVVIYRHNMKRQCKSIKDIWTMKVVVVEKSMPRLSQHSPTNYQWRILTDYEVSNLYDFFILRIKMKKKNTFHTSLFKIFFNINVSMSYSNFYYLIYLKKIILNFISVNLYIYNSLCAKWWFLCKGKIAKYRVVFSVVIYYYSKAL